MEIVFAGDKNGCEYEYVNRMDEKRQKGKSQNGKASNVARVGER
jgi:hypothetical protein